MAAGCFGGWGVNDFRVWGFSLKVFFARRKKAKRKKAWGL